MKKLSLIILMCCMPALLHADDTIIYGVSDTQGVAPNVLVIFDTSGSMRNIDDRDAEFQTTYSDIDYDSSVVYEPRIYLKEQPYYASSANADAWNKSSYNKDSVPGNDCDDLETKGSCHSSNDNDYVMGNRLNQLYGKGVAGDQDYRENYLDKKRSDVVKEVINELLDDAAYNNVNFGLMRFNYNDGGEIIAGCGTETDESLKQITMALEPNGNTPLSEVLAEAGLYFAGEASYYNSGVNYTSPITEKCQKQYIILLTDGQPTQDYPPSTLRNNYLGGSIGGSSNYLDDYALFLNTHDVFTDGSAASIGDQLVSTYTIGFRTNQTLLQSTADNGGGTYFTADDITGLRLAFVTIFNEINEINSNYVAPAVPVNRANRLQDSDWLYLAMFLPQKQNEWKGNIKKFKIGDDGQLYDKNGNLAVDAAEALKQTALSYWTDSSQVSDGADGPSVLEGGLGQVLKDRTDPRKLYTNVSAGQSELTAPENAFNAANINISDEAAVIDRVVNGEGGWRLGDIIHSEPAIVHYGRDNSYIFVGANDGMLHCFDDATGEEEWGFIPQPQLSRLHLLLGQGDGTNSNDYYLDGSPTVSYSDEFFSDTYLNKPEVLIIGERRGGSHYYALDISDVDAPKIKYTINESKVPGLTLGQSWSKPVACKLMKPGAAPTAVKAFVMGGGYDENQDSVTPAAVDTKGQCIYAVEASNGNLIGALTPASLPSSMTHSIIDVSVYDPDGDGVSTRMYAGDMNGNVFIMADDIELQTDGTDVTARVVDPDGNWDQYRKFFTASDTNAADKRKIFYAPDVANACGTEMVYVGTGDRANPKKTDVTNRFYALQNDWTDTVEPTGLVDLTNDKIQTGTDVEKENLINELKTSDGWYLNLETGEKVISSPMVYAGVVYFSTYTPPSSTGTYDPCDTAGSLGEGRLYAVDACSAEAVYNWDKGNDAEFAEQKAENARKAADDAYILWQNDPTNTELEDNYDALNDEATEAEDALANGTIGAHLGKEDRYISLPQTPMGMPTIKDGDVRINTKSMEAIINAMRNYYFWRN